MSAMVDRVRGMLLSPKSEWERVAAEPGDSRAIWTGWVLPLAVIGPVAGLVGGIVFGHPVADVVGISFGFSYYLRAALVALVQSVVAVAVVATLAKVLAPTFGAACDGIAGLKLAAYSFTAAWVAGIFMLVPFLAPLSFLGLYSLYLLYLGIRPITGVSEDKALPYSAALIVVGVVVSMALGWVVS